MFRKTLEKFSRGRAIVRMHLQPRVDKRTDQPGPDRALMIRAIARPQITAVNWFVIGIVGRERTESNWSHQSLLRNLDDRLPTLRIQNRMIERNGEELIRPAGRIAIGAAVNVDNVKKVGAFGEPKLGV